MHEVRFKLAFISLRFHCVGRIVNLATNCFGCLQKDTRTSTFSLSRNGDPAQTLMNKHASHVWSKVLLAFNRRATRSAVFIASAALLDYGIVLDSARASYFHLVRSIYSLLKKAAI